MAAEYSIFDLVFAVAKFFWDGTIWIIKTTLLSILHFFMNPYVKYTTLLLILLICIYVGRRIWRNRDGSLYEIFN